MFCKVDDPQREGFSQKLAYFCSMLIKFEFLLHENLYSKGEKYKWSFGLDKIQSGEHRISRHPVITVIFPNENTPHFFPAHPAVFLQQVPHVF